MAGKQQAKSCRLAAQLLNILWFSIYLLWARPTHRRTRRTCLHSCSTAWRTLRSRVRGRCSSEENQRNHIYVGGHEAKEQFYYFLTPTTSVEKGAIN